MPESSKYLRENLVLDNGHLLDQVLKRSCILQRIVQKEPGIILRKKCCWNSQKADILPSVQTTPASRGSTQKHRTWKTVDTLRCRWTNNWNNFSNYSFCQSAQCLRSQWQLYVKNLRAVKMDRVNRRFWWVNQLFLGAIEAEVLSAERKTLWIIKFYGNSTLNELNRFHQKVKWVDSVRKQDLWRIVEVGQYFVTKDTGNSKTISFSGLSRTHSFLERIQLHKQKDGFKETWELDLYWKSWPVSSTSSMELKFELSQWTKTGFSFLGQNFWRNGQIRGRFYSRQHRNSCRYTRRANSTNKHECGCRQVKGKSKNLNRGNLLGRQQPYQYKNEGWIDVETHQNKILLRTTSRRKWSIFFDTIQTLQREEDGAIEFCRIKFYLRDHHSPKYIVWSDDRWKACLAAEEEDQNEDISISVIIREQFSTFRALQGHSGSNLIDLTLQDNVLIGTGIFPYIHHVGSTFNLHSIINNGLVPGGQNLSRRQTVFFLPVDPRDESHRDPERTDFSVPRLARYMYSAWKRHQDAVFWVDINLAIKRH